MLKRIMVAAAAVLSAAVYAQAADIVEAPPTFDWSGPYVGLQAGYGWGESTFAYEEDFPIERVDLDFDGFVGGLTLGYNHQMESLVVGIEGDVSYSDLDDEVLRPPTDAPCYIEGCSIGIDWFGTARLRLGYALDTVMPFITGGLAFGGVEGTFDEGACACDIDDTSFGWTIGGGLEWAVDESWSVKAEYLYVDLGHPDIEGASPSSVSTSRFDFSVLRAGVNWRF